MDEGTTIEAGDVRGEGCICQPYSDITGRKSDVEKAYTSPNYEEIKNIIDKYDIKYIYVGEVERDRYQVTGVYEKNKEAFELVFNNRDVEIYEVK